MDLNNSKRAKMAMANFKKGYNCAQSTFLAFNDLIDMDYDTAARLSSSMGGGMGRLREVCGALSGIFMISGILYGYDDIQNADLKVKHYERIQYLAKQFKDENKRHSIICRDLLNLDIKGADIPIPQARTEEYYKERPCEELCGLSAAILEKYIKENPCVVK